MQHHEYFAAGTRDTDERARLASLEAAFDPKTIRHLNDLGVGPGWKCLEVGAGGGSIARWLSEKVGPAGQVVATDIDTRFIRSIGNPNVEARLHDITSDGLESETYDLVHCRFLLMHMRDPELVIGRMVDAAKPGGWVVVEEPDFSSYRAADSDHPRSDAFTRMVQDTFKNAVTSALFDSYFGPRAEPLLERAGLSDVGGEATAYLWRGGEAEAEEHWRSLPVLVRAGLCSQTDSAEMAKLLGDPDFTFVGHTVFSAWGRREDQR